MNTAAAWRDLCNDPARRAEEYVTDTVVDIMRAGRTRDVAIAMAAERLGISPRKVRSLYYGQPCAVPLSFLDALRIGVVRHLRAEMAETARRLDLLQRKLQETEAGIGMGDQDAGDPMGAVAREPAAQAVRARRLHGRAVAAAYLARGLLDD